MRTNFAAQRCYGQTLCVLCSRGHNFVMLESIDKINVACTSKHYIDYICLVENQSHKKCEMLYMYMDLYYLLAAF